MKVSSKIFGIAVAILAMTFFSACASKKSVAGTTAVSPTAISNPKVALVEDALNQYKDWNSAQVNGKIRMESLPVSPSVKIYMKRGKELIISASAILVGEVFRLELNEDSLFIVNKLKKVYCKESGEKLQTVYPTLCEELQSVFLGRMIVPGNGTLSASNIDRVAIDMEKDLRKVSPDLGEFPIDVNAYYLLDNQGRIESLTVEGEAAQQIFFLGYDWKGNGGVDLDAVVSRKKKSPFKVEIQLDAPKWEAAPLSPYKLGKGFKRVGLQDFFKSI